jgi:hypothetical protein
MVRASVLVTGLSAVVERDANNEAKHDDDNKDNNNEDDNDNGNADTVAVDNADAPGFTARDLEVS